MNDAESAGGPPAITAEDELKSQKAELETEAQAPPGQAAPEDADDLRGFHFRRLGNKKVSWIGAILLAIAAGVGIGIAAGPALGLIAAGASPLLVVLIVYLLAASAAEDAFFKAYADARGMTRTEGGDWPAITPLLRKGDEREAPEILRGKLADGADGAVGLYTYTDVYYDKNGRHETDYHFTIGMTEVPECVSFVPELYCQRKFGFAALEKLEDVFRKNERVELESVKLDKRYEIFAGPNQDANWLRQFFSPSFIVWLSEEAPEKVAFELVAGMLVVNVKGHKKSAKELDLMRRVTATIAGRLREESRE